MNHLPENHSGATSDEHLIQLWLSGRPETTQRAYRFALKDFQAFLSKPLSEVTVADLTHWAEKLKGSDATKNLKVSALKSLFDYAHRTGYLVFNVGLPIRCLRPLDRVHERILEFEDIRSILAASSSGRDQILIRFLYVSGARISEAVRLRFTDIRGVRVTLQGKGRKTRTLLVSEGVAKELMSLRLSTDSDTSPVFKSVRGKPLDPRNARQVIKDAAEYAGLDMSAHWLRHSHASHALDNGAPIHLVSHCLGHSNVATTSRYLHASPKDGTSRFLEDL